MYFTSKSKRSFKSAIGLCLLLFCFLHSAQAKNFNAELEDFVGNQDAVLVADPQGRVIFSKNATIQPIPASTLKILTTLVALHYLGPDYRFVTEFYLDQELNLKVKGYGDPLLISETLAEITKALASRLDTKFKKTNDLVLDDSYFKAPIIIPGVGFSYEPYDAPNGALCVNFNTVNFRRNQNGVYVSAEPQTPLLPFVLARVNASATDQGRILLSHKKNECTLYAGHLFSYFLQKDGLESKGRIRIGKVQKDIDQLIFRYASGFSLEQVIPKLLEHSNNFIANQLLIATGANVYGPPATLDKGVQAAKTYAKEMLKTDSVRIVEGSGISRDNRVSAKFMHAILEKFKPYHRLMHKTGSAFFKTGTLEGIKTRAGYVENVKGELYCFVILLNTPGKSPERIMDILLRNLT